MKKNKTNSKLIKKFLYNKRLLDTQDAKHLDIKEIENSLSKRAEVYLYEEIKKRITQNPDIMNQFFNQKVKSSLEPEE